MSHTRVSALVPQTRVVDTGDENTRVVAAQVEQTLAYPDGGHSRLADQSVTVDLVWGEDRWKADRVDVVPVDDEHTGKAQR